MIPHVFITVRWVASTTSQARKPPSGGVRSFSLLVIESRDSESGMLIGVKGLLVFTLISRVVEIRTFEPG